MRPRVSLDELGSSTCCSRQEVVVAVGAKEVGEPLQKEGGEIRKRYSYTLVEKVNLKFITQIH